MNKTPNYNLNQWDTDDRVQRTDFNADNAKIDAALAALAGRVKCGTYVGTGKYGDKEESDTVLRLGFRPRVVLITSEINQYVLMFVWPANAPLGLSFGNGIRMNGSWMEDGLRWRLYNAYSQTAADQFNAAGVTYHYIAFQ